jgi:hypothetical protein
VAVGYVDKMFFVGHSTILVTFIYRIFLASVGEFFRFLHLPGKMRNFETGGWVTGTNGEKQWDWENWT